MTPVAKQWIRDRLAIELPDELSVEFDRFLSGLPWQGASSLDWSRMPPMESIDVRHGNAIDFANWLKATRIGSHSYIAVWYSVTEGGIVVPAGSLTLESLDALYWQSPGIRFSFGVDMRDRALVPSYSDLLEYGKGDLLVAVRR